MHKKYQVFVSSTYEDLKDERSAAIQYLLDNDCIPVGMEQFPASNMSQMEYIKKMLADCDYYILILAGRYGTGYTEKEYDYACEHGIPVLSFVIKDVDSLPVNRSECEPGQRKKLEAFRKKVCSSKLVKFYTNVDSLKAEIATSINKAIRDTPAAGWVRGKKETAQIETKLPIWGNVIQNLKTASLDKPGNDLLSSWNQICSERKNNSTLSQRAYDIFCDLSKKEVEIFQRMSSVTITTDNDAFITADLTLLGKYNVSYTDIVLLGDCGLISTSSVVWAVDFPPDPKACIKISSGKSKVRIRNLTPREIPIRIPIYKLSKVGFELISKLPVSYSKEHLKAFAEKIFIDSGKILETVLYE